MATTTVAQRLEDARQQVRNLEAQLAQEGTAEAGEIEHAASIRRQREKSELRERFEVTADLSDEQIQVWARQLGYHSALPTWAWVRILELERKVARLSQ